MKEKKDELGFPCCNYFFGDPPCTNCGAMAHYKTDWQWKCGRCGTINYRYLSTCDGCGKEKDDHIQ